MVEVDMGALTFLLIVLIVVYFLTLYYMLKNIQFKKRVKAFIVDKDLGHEFKHKIQFEKWYEKL